MIKEFHPVLFGQFLLFFPTISSGPIDRYRRFEADYAKVPERSAYLDMVEKGVRYIFQGFLYKFILAYIFGSIMMPQIQQRALMAHGFSWNIVAYMYVYSMDLFFDFAGYSLFAVGISYMMGIKTPMNFNQPFKSKNIKDFWNRWHMTLSFWFRDYIFMRLVFFCMKHHIFKSRTTTANVCYVINMLIMGFGTARPGTTSHMVFTMALRWSSMTPGCGSRRSIRTTFRTTSLPNYLPSF